MESEVGFFLWTHAQSSLDAPFLYRSLFKKRTARVKGLVNFILGRMYNFFYYLFLDSVLIPALECQIKYCNEKEQVDF